jgi:activating signal cointegrator 1
MKALSLTQPWAILIAEGTKTIETRSWPTRYRGPLLIHAAKGFPRDARDFAEEIDMRPADLPLGALIAVAYLTECIRTDDLDLRAISGTEKVFGDFSPGRWAWFLDKSRLRVFPEPLPWRGAQGLWDMPERLLPSWARAIA